MSQSNILNYFNLLHLHPLNTFPKSSVFVSVYICFKWIEFCFTSNTQNLVYSKLPFRENSPRFPQKKSCPLSTICLGINKAPANLWGTCVKESMGGNSAPNIWRKPTNMVHTRVSMEVSNLSTMDIPVVDSILTRIEYLPWTCFLLHLGYESQDKTCDSKLKI